MITTFIELDINNEFYERVIAKQGDTKSRSLKFRIIDDYKPFDLEGKSVRVYAEKPDKTTVFNDLTINNAVDGTCTLELTNQLLAVAGIVKIELMIFEGETKLTTIPFDLDVIESINSDEVVESSDEFNALVSTLDKVNKGLEEINNWNSEFSEKSGKLEELYTPKLNKIKENVEINKNKLERCYYLDEYKKGNDVSYLEAFNRIISEIDEGYSCNILLKNKEYTLHDTLNIINKSINIIGIGGKIKDKSPRNATGTNIRYIGEKNNIPLIRFINCYGSKVSGVSFVGNEDYSFHNRGVIGIVATATMEGDSFTGHCRYLTINDCSFYRLYSGVKLGENNLCVVEFTTINNCEFFQNRIGVHILTINVYSTNIDNSTFLGYEKEKYHIYCENGHFSSSTCFFGPCGNTDEIGGGYAIYLKKGYCNLYDTYAEIHKGTFLVWENAHPSYARTNIYGADIRRRVEDEPNETNVKNMTDSMLNVFGGYYDGKFELSNPKGQININGVRQPLFINSNLDKICCNNSFLNNRNINALYKNTIYGDSNGNAELEFYNGEDQSFIKIKRENKEIRKESSFGVGIVEDFERKILNLGATSWGIRLCSQNGGSFTLSEGQTEMEILNTSITNASKIFIYPVSSDSVTLDITKRLYVKAKNVGSGFVVRLNDSSRFPSNCKYDYLVFDGNW